MIWIGLIAAASIASAHEGHEMKGSLTSIHGEVVDMQCYLQGTEKGMDPKKCAQTCAQRGVPMSLLSSDGKLTLLVPDEDNLAPYDQLKDLAAEQVYVTGNLVTKGGMRALVVEKIVPPKGAKTAASAKTYVCLMDPDVKSDKPGKCPKCGMDLVEQVASPVAGTDTKDTALKPYYCPMDADVQSDKPGVCPKCGMDLEKRK